jgi:hypothetical protein
MQATECEQRDSQCFGSVRFGSFVGSTDFCCFLAGSARFQYPTNTEKHGCFSFLGTQQCEAHKTKTNKQNQPTKRNSNSGT